MFALPEPAEPEYYFRFLSLHPKHSTFKSLFTELTTNNVSMTKGSQPNLHSFPKIWKKFYEVFILTKNILDEFIYLSRCILSFTTPRGLFGLRSGNVEPTELYNLYCTLYFTQLCR